MLDTNNSDNNQIHNPNTTLRLLHIGPKQQDKYGNPYSPVWSKLETIVPVKLAWKEARSELRLVKSKERLSVKMNDKGEECYQEQH